MTKLEWALALASAGYRVFPLTVNGKRPAIKQWPERATTDKALIELWWQDRDYNIGVATGQGVIVLDYDTKPGQNGAKALELHEALDLPRGFRVRTASGGLHVYLRSPIEIHNSASLLAQNVDVRGEGGYVVGPGSKVNGTEYLPV